MSTARPKNENSADVIKVKVHDKLLETGEYERMKSFLREKLLEAGWFDEINVLALDKLSTQEKPSFETVAESLETQALDMIPDDIKIELLRKIRGFLDTWVESKNS
ncbi:uncharacterized protein SAPINGB_P003686 [Magnusiomyces paraingens]|uniref:Transcription and mRNA export factor SUS1 n=1 Tax=Magnusiomyces paraingens TaxID=2606893 RepID=A0A5E8BRG9_9ASCO|nr:uncharacterized protein SAPINGB_P003686 [Saprochaete ingens]VVT53661.1 unnamed protein product [Saprochaete ingens]